MPYSTSFGGRIFPSPLDSVSEWTRKAIDRWVNETESFIPPIALTSESVETFGEASIFLSDPTPGIKALVFASPSSASGRKLSLRVIAHEFNYDVVWTPKVKTSEKHLINELRNFSSDSLMTEQGGGTIGGGGGDSMGDGSEKRILILLDQVHFDEMASLLKHLYTFCREEGEKYRKLFQATSSSSEARRKSSAFLPSPSPTMMSSSSSLPIIRLCLIKEGPPLSLLDDFIWSHRVACVRVVRPFSDDSLKAIPSLILSELERMGDEMTSDDITADFDDDEESSTRERGQIMRKSKNDDISSQSKTKTTKTDSMKNFSTKVYQLFSLFPPHLRADRRKYFSLILTFSKLFQDKKVDTQRKRKEFIDKISKLETTSREVEKLKSDAATQREILAKKRKEADEALSLITSSMTASEDQKVELEVIKAKTESETAKLRVRKKEIDAELASIEPTLQAAKAAVAGIKSETLSEIRSLRAPPEVIRDILEGVLRLMGVNDTSWVSMKSFLARRGVKEEIINFDARKISPEMSAKVEDLLSKRPASFDEKVAKRASAAAAPLANWVMANLSFARVLQKIKPLEDEQNALESGLRSAQTRMSSLGSQLAGVEDQVGQLRDRLNQVTLEAAQTEINLKQTAQTLKESEALVQELSGQYKHWKEQLDILERKLASLSSRCLIAAAVVVLMGSFYDENLDEGECDSLVSPKVNRFSKGEQLKGFPSSNSPNRIRIGKEEGR